MNSLPNNPTPELLAKIEEIKAMEWTDIKALAATVGITSKPDGSWADSANEIAIELFMQQGLPLVEIETPAEPDPTIDDKDEPPAPAQANQPPTQPDSTDMTQATDNAPKTEEKKTTTAAVPRTPNATINPDLYLVNKKKRAVKWRQQGVAFCPAADCLEQKCTDGNGPICIMGRSDEECPILKKHVQEELQRAQDAEALA